MQLDNAKEDAGEHVAFCTAPMRAHTDSAPVPETGPPIEELLTEVISNEWVNDE